MEQEMSKIFTTPKGTELPVMALKGKDYLEVKYRLVWFREEHPNYGIETEFVSVTEKGSVARAVIRDESGRIIATSHKSETESGFPDFMEKSETGAIGRALALMGFGTQFCADELDEHQRIVDSPAIPTGKPNLQAVPAPSSDPGAYVIKCGKKYAGMSLDKIGPHDAVSYAHYLKTSAQQKNQPLTGYFLEAVNAIEAFAQSRTPKGAQK
jgi:hypothetical protein